MSGETSVDEHLLTAAKLMEQARGDLDGDRRLLDHAGFALDADDRGTLSFAKSLDVDLGDLGETVEATMMTDTATRAVETGNASVMSNLVGVTEQDLDASSLRLPMMLLDQLHNNEAPAFVSGAGNPNTGKTTLMVTLAELWKLDRPDDALVLANFDTDVVDRRVTSAHDLAVVCLEERHRPKFVILDEGSTHFDARTYRREVAQQFTPLAKRFAKIGVDVFGLVVHTGKDMHPEAKRLTTLAYYKLEKKVSDFFETWDSEAEMPEDRLFGGSVESIENAASDLDPDDSAPWAWDLEPELFALDLDWPELLDELRDRGPVE